MSQSRTRSIYEAVTRGIRVRVQPQYLEHDSEPDDNQFVWAYTIDIENEGTETVQLRTRHWIITDGNGRVEHVRGPGVVGQTPTLSAGEQFRYTSGCKLTTPSGIMVGTFQMTSQDSDTFDVAIPAFSLDSPEGRRVVN